ncbi:MAG: hypothetical protein H6745_11975 [Deltaproteobacteria bacterium]|nr:hypothetical protein [Deltaproteobacteria bacterium]
MLRRTLSLGSLALLLALGTAACGDDDGGTTTTDTVSTADTLSPNDTTTADTAVAGPSFDAAHAIFAAKCSPCHTGGGSGGHNMGAADIAAAYADSQLDADIAKCDGLKKGACTIVRIHAGDMPRGAGCTGDPSQDSGNAACLTQAEQDTIQAWIDGGLQPPN